MTSGENLTGHRFKWKPNRTSFYVKT